MNRMVRMDEYCSSVRDGTHDTPKPTSDGKYLVTSKAIHDNTIDFSSCYFISQKDFDKINARSKVDKWDVLMTMIGSVGRLLLVQNEPDYAIKNIALFKIGNEDKAKWLYFYLSNKPVQDYFEAIASGTSQHFIGLGHLRKLKIADFNENSKKVVSILSAYDNLIENNNKRIKILEQMAENLYKEWFVRFRFPGHETTPLENGIPKGWKLKHVSEIGDIIGGGTPSTDNEEYWNGNIPWLSPADLTDYQGVYIDKGANNITELGLAKSSAKMMPKDTVLLSSRAPIGYVALAKNDICTNQGFKSIVCNQSIMKPSYLYLYFKLNKSYLQSFASGATFPELSGSMVKKLKVLVPDISLLEKFDTFAKKLFEKTDVLLTQNQNLIKQRDLLLPRLMSGKLAV